MTTRTTHRGLRPGAGPVIGLDLGGTKIAAALVGPDGAVLARHTLATPATAGSDAVLDALRDAARAVDRRAVAVGVAAAGVVDPRSGTVTSATDSISGWAGTALGPGLADRTGLPVAPGEGGRHEVLGDGFPDRRHHLGLVGAYGRRAARRRGPGQPDQGAGLPHRVAGRGLAGRDDAVTGRGPFGDGLEPVGGPSGEPLVQGGDAGPGGDRVPGSRGRRAPTWPWSPPSPVPWTFPSWPRAVSAIRTRPPRHSRTAPTASSSAPPSPLPPR